MTDSPKTPETETTETPEGESRPADEKTLDRIANKFAKRAERTENKYDESHDNNFKI